MPFNQGWIDLNKVGAEIDPFNQSGALGGGLANLDPTNPNSGMSNFLSGGAIDAAKKNQADTQAAVDGLNFTPVNVSTPQGGYAVDPETGAYTVNVGSDYTGARDGYLGAAGPATFQQYGGDPGLDNLRSGMLDAAGQPLTGLTGTQQTAMDNIGGLSTAGDVNLQQQSVGAANPNMFRSDVTGPQTNTSNLLKQQYDNLRKTIAPQQERARSSLENRLFAQGMLGSTGGSQRTEALLNSQAQQDAGLLDRAFGQAQQVANTELNRFNSVAGDEFRRQNAFAGQDLNRGLANANFGAQFQGQQLDQNAMNFTQGLNANNAMFGMSDLGRQLNSPERQLSLLNAGAQGAAGIDTLGMNQQNLLNNNFQLQQNAGIQNLAAGQGIDAAAVNALGLGNDLAMQAYNRDVQATGMTLGANVALNNAGMGSTRFLRDTAVQGGMAYLTGGASLIPQAQGMFGGGNGATVAGQGSANTAGMFAADPANMTGYQSPYGY